MFPDYIPAGCLIFWKEDDTLPDDIWENEGYTEWRALAAHQHGDNDDNDDGAAIPSTLPVLAEHQKVIFRRSGVPRLERLVEDQWIKLEFSIATHPDSSTYAALRVYLLPDDLKRSSIDRDSQPLTKARRTLFAKLDFSASAWNKRADLSPCPSPEMRDPLDEDEESLSLLELFNVIPPPDPQPSDICDETQQFAVASLLASQVDGLTSELYPYQRRSAALMASREAQPGQFIDPRIVQVKDQNDADWWYDAPANGIFRHPRYYDGVQGGILAEQMGSGKTLICLSLVLATRFLPTEPPAYRAIAKPVRKRIGSLADMAASQVTSNGLPHRWYFDAAKAQNGMEYTKCLEAIGRNPGFYEIPPPEPRRVGRNAQRYIQPEQKPKQVVMSQTTIVFAPSNLVMQWQREITKHTEGLSYLMLSRKKPVPPASQLAMHDIILCTHNQLEAMVRDDPEGPMASNPLSSVHFKRCIVDEGHRLGTSTINTKSDFLRGLESLQVSCRWLVTGTPAKGLYGVDQAEELDGRENTPTSDEATKSQDLEKSDLERIGAIARLYLKARPWANTVEEGESLADWKVYVMQPKHSSKGKGRQSSLRATLNSLIIRHPLSQLSHMLPPVEEKVVYLDGSYQDKLAINTFSAMIIFNAVQSERKDMDYFFHPRQRKALLELVFNLKQASFFGGAFFSDADIQQSVETAEYFLKKGEVAVSEEDGKLFGEAMGVAFKALGNVLRRHSNQTHEVPVFVENFLPGEASEAWSFEGTGGEIVGTNTTMILAVQKLIRSALNDEAELNGLLNGGLVAKGMEQKAVQTGAGSGVQPTTAGHIQRGAALAGNTKVGDGQSPKNLRTNALHIPLQERKTEDSSTDKLEVPESLKQARLVSTSSAKLTYLLDSIFEHSKDEQIIVFYESSNMAWYIAGMLDVIQIEYLIYDKSLKAERKAQYIHTFNNESRFRVLLMDINQAAFGLDMRAASRVYFVHPVLNPQIEAQAIGRVRRISQQKPVSVETLVLRGSLEEVIMERKSTMTQAEHWRVKSILDDKPIYNWILNAGILPLPEGDVSPLDQTIWLKHPQPLFRKGFGEEEQDRHLLALDMGENGAHGAAKGRKRSHGEVVGDEPEANGVAGREEEPAPARRVKFA